MISISFKMDIDAARSSLNNVKVNVNKAAARALDRVATTVRKEASQVIRQKLKISAGVAKATIDITRPLGGQALIRNIVASGHPIPLRDFNARQTGRGVTYQVSTSRGRRVYTNKFGPGFIVNKFGGHVFARVTPDPPGPQKAKIATVYGPSVPQYFVTKTVRERMQTVARERWAIEFEREMNYRRSLA